MRVLVLLALAAAAAAQVDLGISFNETLQGYFTNGDMDFQQAYDQGKAANRVIRFTSHIVMAHMRAFTNTSQHAADLNGHIFARGLTGLLGTEVSDGVLNLFNGSVYDHELEMHYYVPFKGLDQQPYHVEGVKYVKGDNCSHIFSMMTTLFIHVRRGHVRAQGTIVSSGIVHIDLAQVLELAGSIRVVGNGTDADKLDAIAEFGTLLLEDFAADCFNVSNWRSQFWYVWASNGRNGFLLDLVARPDTLELRLETYGAGVAPVVTKQYLSIEDLSTANNSVAFGNEMYMTMTRCAGAVKSLNVDLTYALKDKNDFVPEIIYLALKGLVPQIESYYGTIGNGTVAGVNYAGTAIARTTYAFEVGLEWLQWVMISALSFDDTDLRIEVIGVKLANSTIIATSYVFFHGTAYHLNDPLVASTRFTESGAIVNGTRVFGARITKSKEIDIVVECSAPLLQFALLDVEGDTAIHTTVLGACTASETISGGTFRGTSALLELKEKQ